jgi:hypothetical protein
MAIPTPAPGRVSRPRYVAAVAVPLALAGLAYVLWWISDRLLYVGPLDRAAFGWVVVVPVWISAPVAAGFVWRTLDRRTMRVIAALVGTAIAAAAALLLWQAVAFPACETGAIHAPQDMVPPSLLVGAVVGGGVAWSGLVSARFALGGRPIAAVVLGAAAEALMVVVALLVLAWTLLGPACQRPSV